MIGNMRGASLSPASSTTSSHASDSVKMVSNGDGDHVTYGLSDEQLAQISVRQLNQKLMGQDRRVVMELKQKRRTLKNRGYALNCRARRVQNQMQLEADNVMLRNQIKHLREALQETQLRLQYYEPICSSTHADFYSPTINTNYPPQLYHHHPLATNLHQNNLVTNEPKFGDDYKPIF